MSVPLYNLVVVNERGRMGKNAALDADRLFENIIRGGAARCFVYQLTVSITGIWLLLSGSLGISAVWSDPVIAMKTLILILLTSLLSYVNFGLQPRIDAAMEGISEASLPEDTLSLITPLRSRRKKLAAVCLFLLISEIILGAQVYSRFGIITTLIMLAAGALFSRHAYKSLLRFGWI